MSDMIDRDAVIARLLAYGTASTEKAAEAIAALPAVTVNEETFMAAVWDALKTDANDLRKQQRILRAFRAALEPVTQPAPDAAFASGFKAGLKAAAEHWFRGVSGVRQLLPETKAQILAIPCPQPAPDAAAIREAYREGWAFAYRQWEATGSVPQPTEKPHDRA